MKSFLQALKVLTVLTLLTGVAYPALVWAFGWLVFPREAEGSQVHRAGVLVGSLLIAQANTDARYFSSRPSAAAFATRPSGASNLFWSSKQLQEAIESRRAQFGGTNASSDLLTASGSGLDPELSVEGVHAQAQRVATARNLDAAGRERLDDLIARHTVGGQASPRRVNILQLNLALDEAFPQ